MPSCIRLREPSCHRFSLVWRTFSRRRCVVIPVKLDSLLRRSLSVFDGNSPTRSTSGAEFLTGFIRGCQSLHQPFRRGLRQHLGDKGSLNRGRHDRKIKIEPNGLLAQCKSDIHVIHNGEFSFSCSASYEWSEWLSQRSSDGKFPLRDFTNILLLSYL